MNKDRGYISLILWFMGGSIVGMIVLFFIMKLIGKTDQMVGLLCIPWLVNGSLIIKHAYFLEKNPSKK